MKSIGNGKGGNLDLLEAEMKGVVQRLIWA